MPGTGLYQILEQKLIFCYSRHSRLLFTRSSLPFGWA